MMESLLHELNPKYDLERHRTRDEDSWNWIMREPALRLINMTKSAVRGGIAGAFAGYVIEGIFDDPNEGLISGAVAGGFLDIFQYGVRLDYKAIKEQCAIIKRDLMPSRNRKN